MELGDTDAALLEPGRCFFAHKMYKMMQEIQRSQGMRQFTGPVNISDAQHALKHFAINYIKNCWSLNKGEQVYFKFII